jgi:hypothetical protein
MKLTNKSKGGYVSAIMMQQISQNIFVFQNVENLKLYSIFNEHPLCARHDETKDKLQSLLAGLPAQWKTSIERNDGSV